MSELARLYRLVRKDLVRFAIMAAIASAMLFASTPIARAVGEPGIAVAGLVSSLVVYGVGLVPVLRRVLMDYIDLREVYDAAKIKDPGRVFQGVCIVIAALLLALAMGTARASTVPPQALQHLPTLGQEIARHWPAAPDWAILAGQVEKESCITLQHPRCWNPRAELRTSREQGVGLGQITRTGRFDALSELKAQFREELAGWAWDSPSLYDPAYQLRALVLMDRRNFQAITGVVPADHMAMALVAYNGGLGGLASDRRVCQATPGCDPARWWGHVEHTSLKARTAAKGYGKSFFEINRDYPRSIAQRAEKYRPLVGA